MIVIKKINNNVAICKDNNNHELVAFGKGIGFPSIPYQITDLKKIDRTFYNISPQYLSLINELSFEIVEFTADQLIKIQDILSYETNPNLVFTLADHLTFAIERAEKGIYVNMPSSYEMELDYPQEMKAGKVIWNAICKKFHIHLSKVEIQGIADCVDKICIYYQNVWSIQLSEEEKLYLILHVNRVCSREDN